MENGNSLLKFLPLGLSDPNHFQNRLDSVFCIHFHRSMFVLSNYLE